MKVHTAFAHISDGEVKNLSVGDYYNTSEICRMEYGKDAFVIDVTQYPVDIGDKYVNGEFKREINGELVTIDPLPTEEQAIQILTAENAELREQLDNLAMAFLEATKGEA